MPRFLEHIRIDRYGALADYDVGPFGPGLNVVFGPNEAGKSTIASFVGGVLFGWEEAHGVRNTYRPPEGERSGTLVFKDAESGEGLSLSRKLNEDGVQGDVGLVSDIDHATYRTMFALSSDELRSLRNTSDVTTRLLTAGSGTGSSPSSAFVELEQRIAAKTAPAQDSEESIARLNQLVEEKQAQITAAREENELRKQEDRERADLAESRASATAHLDELNERIEGLHAARARIEELDAAMEKHRAEIDTLTAEQLEHTARKSTDTGLSPRLLSLDASEERSLREKLEELADGQAKVQRGVDLAKENSTSSSAAYEALLEMSEADVEQARALPADTKEERQLRKQAVADALLGLRCKKAMEKYYPDGKIDYEEGALPALYEKEAALADEKRKLLASKKDKDALRRVNAEQKATQKEIKVQTAAHQRYAESTKVITEAQKWLKTAACYDKFGELHSRYVPVEVTSD